MTSADPRVFHSFLTTQWSLFTGSKSDSSNVIWPFKDDTTNGATKNPTSLLSLSSRESSSSQVILSAEYPARFGSVTLRSALARFIQELSDIIQTTDRQTQLLVLFFESDHARSLSMVVNDTQRWNEKMLENPSAFSLDVSSQQLIHEYESPGSLSNARFSNMTMGDNDVSKWAFLCGLEDLVATQPRELIQWWADEDILARYSDVTDIDSWKRDIVMSVNNQFETIIHWFPYVYRLTFKERGFTLEKIDTSGDDDDKRKNLLLSSQHIDSPYYNDPVSAFYHMTMDIAYTLYCKTFEWRIPKKYMEMAHLSCMRLYYEFKKKKINGSVVLSCMDSMENPNNRDKNSPLMPTIVRPFVFVSQFERLPQYLSLFFDNDADEIVKSLLIIQSFCLSLGFISQEDYGDDERYNFIKAVADMKRDSTASEFSMTKMSELFVKCLKWISSEQAETVKNLLLYASLDIDHTDMTKEVLDKQDMTLLKRSMELALPTSEHRQYIENKTKSLETLAPANRDISNLILLKRLALSLSGLISKNDTSSKARDMFDSFLMYVLPKLNVAHQFNETDNGLLHDAWQFQSTYWRSLLFDLLALKTRQNNIIQVKGIHTWFLQRPYSKEFAIGNEKQKTLSIVKQSSSTPLERHLQNWKPVNISIKPLPLPIEDAISVVVYFANHFYGPRLWQYDAKRIDSLLKICKRCIFYDLAESTIVQVISLVARFFALWPRENDPKKEQRWKQTLLLFSPSFWSNLFYMLVQFDQTQTSILKWLSLFLYQMASTEGEKEDISNDPSFEPIEFETTFQLQTPTKKKKGNNSPSSPLIISNASTPRKPSKIIDPVQFNAIVKEWQTDALKRKKEFKQLYLSTMEFGLNYKSNTSLVKLLKELEKRQEDIKKIIALLWPPSGSSDTLLYNIQKKRLEKITGIVNLVTTYINESHARDAERTHILLSRFPWRVQEEEDIFKTPSSPTPPQTPEQSPPPKQIIVQESIEEKAIRFLDEIVDRKNSWKTASRFEEAFYMYILYLATCHDTTTLDQRPFLFKQKFVLPMLYIKDDNISTFVGNERSFDLSDDKNISTQRIEREIFLNGPRIPLQSFHWSSRRCVSYGADAMNYVLDHPDTKSLDSLSVFKNPQYEVALAEFLKCMPIHFASSLSRDLLNFESSAKNENDDDEEDHSKILSHSRQMCDIYSNTYLKIIYNSNLTENKSKIPFLSYVSPSFTPNNNWIVCHIPPPSSSVRYKRLEDVFEELFITKTPDELTDTEIIDAVQTYETTNSVDLYFYQQDEFSQPVWSSQISIDDNGHSQQLSWNGIEFLFAYSHSSDKRLLVKARFLMGNCPLSLPRDAQLHYILNDILSQSYSTSSLLEAIPQEIRDQDLFSWLATVHEQWSDLLNELSTEVKKRLSKRFMLYCHSKRGPLPVLYDNSSNNKVITVADQGEDIVFVFESLSILQSWTLAYATSGQESRVYQDLLNFFIDDWLSETDPEEGFSMFETFRQDISAGLVISIPDMLPKLIYKFRVAQMEYQTVQQVEQDVSKSSSQIAQKLVSLLGDKKELIWKGLKLVNTRDEQYLKQQQLYQQTTADTQSEDEEEGEVKTTAKTVAKSSDGFQESVDIVTRKFSRIRNWSTFYVDSPPLPFDNEEFNTLAEMAEGTADTEDTVNRLYKILSNEHVIRVTKYLAENLIAVKSIDELISFQRQPVMPSSPPRFGRNEKEKDAIVSQLQLVCGYIFGFLQVKAKDSKWNFYGSLSKWANSKKGVCLVALNEQMATRGNMNRDYLSYGKVSCSELHEALMNIMTEILIPTLLMQNFANSGDSSANASDISLFVLSLFRQLRDTAKDLIRVYVSSAKGVSGGGGGGGGDGINQTLLTSKQEKDNSVRRITTNMISRNLFKDQSKLFFDQEVKPKEIAWNKHYTTSITRKMFEKEATDKDTSAFNRTLARELSLKHEPPIGVLPLAKNVTTKRMPFIHDQAHALSFLALFDSKANALPPNASPDAIVRIIVGKNNAVVVQDFEFERTQKAILSKVNNRTLVSGGDAGASPATGSTTATAPFVTFEELQKEVLVNNNQSLRKWIQQHISVVVQFKLVSSISHSKEPMIFYEPVVLLP